jgi:hypothetical protein
MADNLARKGISDLEKTVVDSDNNVTSKGSSLIDMVNQIPNTWEYIKFNFTGDLPEIVDTGSDVISQYIIGLNNLTISSSDIKFPVLQFCTNSVFKSTAILCECPELIYAKNIKFSDGKAAGNIIGSCGKLEYVEDIDTSLLVDYEGSGITDNAVLKRISNLILPNAALCQFYISACPLLETIEGIDLSSTDFNGWVPTTCPALTTLKVSGLHLDTNLSTLTTLNHESLVYIINNAKTVTGKTLTLGAVNLAKLTDAEKKVATDKGWTLA